MTALLAWLGTLPAPWLYLTLAVAACLENVVPPLPADTVIAVGAFAAAQGTGSALGVWTATMVGNVGGALAMYALGRRVGVDWLVRRAPRLFPARAAARVRAAFARRGVWALALSRFLPAVRALVPPVAGAVGVPVWSAAAAMTVASAAWYAVVCALAFRAGTNAEALLAGVARQQQVLGGVAGGLLVVAGAVWWHRRGRPRA